MSIKMVDISEKRDIIRVAKASGKIKLKKETINLIKEMKVEKGDVISVAKTMAILAVKKTPELIPLCHPIPITNVRVDTNFLNDSIEVTVTVKSIAKTGVEMEALSGVVAALLNIWDMVKAYEKDEAGQYPTTLIYDIRVIKKEKIDT
ncbi:MAG: cyclic pyranopterin monophosphate synthase MoaC [Candidatus Odinarchaeota archaeon]|nr:cyclic pyranopterin monophosphate synthase MoaC [Candidatus Odinarchaeota archaeon]